MEAVGRGARQPDENNSHTCRRGRNVGADLVGLEAAVNIICLDFETFFSDDYTLKKLTTENYIRDERFEALGVGIRWGDDENGGVEWYPSREAGWVLKQIHWKETAVLAHHAHFDGLILSHHYGIKPAFWLDTLSMGRLVHGNSIGLSLGSLAKHYGLEPKTVPYDKFKGKHWNDLSPAVRQELADGCLHDVELTWLIFQKLMG